MNDLSQHVFDTAVAVTRANGAAVAQVVPAPLTNVQLVDLALNAANVDDRIKAIRIIESRAYLDGVREGGRTAIAAIQGAA